MRLQIAISRRPHFVDTNSNVGNFLNTNSDFNNSTARYHHETCRNSLSCVVEIIFFTHPETTLFTKIDTQERTVYRKVRVIETMSHAVDMYSATFYVRYYTCKPYRLGQKYRVVYVVSKFCHETIKLSLNPIQYVYMQQSRQVHDVARS